MDFLIFTGSLGTLALVGTIIAVAIPAVCFLAAERLRHDDPSSEMTFKMNLCTYAGYATGAVLGVFMTLAFLVVALLSVAISESWGLSMEDRTQRGAPTELHAVPGGNGDYAVAGADGGYVVAVLRDGALETVQVEQLVMTDGDPVLRENTECSEAEGGVTFLPPLFVCTTTMQAHIPR